MPHLEGSGAVVSRDGCSIEVLNVENELSRLWDQAQPEDAVGAPRITRAVLLNLVAYCRNQETANRSAQSIAAVTADHPSRAIIVSNPGGSAVGEIKARVSIACQLLNGQNKQVCCEQVFMEAPGMDMRKIIGAVLPLTLPDVPLVLWLPDGCSEVDAALTRFAKASDRVVLDTADCHGSLVWVAELLNQPGPAAIDLAWIRYAQMRLAVAHLFDNERWREYLPKIDKVTISFVGGFGGPGAEALLMAGWIVSRLQWRGLEPGKQMEKERIYYEANTHVLEFCKVSQEGSSRVSGVSFTVEPDVELSVRFDHSAHQAYLDVKASGNSLDQSMFPLTDMTPEQILCGALEISGRDPVYRQSLQAAIAL